MLWSTDVLNNDRIRKKKAICDLLLSIVAVAEGNTGGENLWCYVLKLNMFVKPNPTTTVIFIYIYIVYT